MRKGIRAAAMLLTAAMLTGCWDRTELDDISITSAAAVDWKDNQWLVSYQVVIPSAISGGGAMGSVQGGSSKLPVAVYSTHGPTIREAIGQSVFESPRKLFFSHTQVFIVSTDMLRKGVEELIDVFFRNPDARETVSVLVSDGDARDILKELMQIQFIPGDGIYETLQRESRMESALPDTSIFKLTMQLAGSAHNAVLPEIALSGSEPVTKADQLKSTTVPSKLRLRRLAVLKEGRFAGWLGQEEALGVAFLRDEVHQTVLPFPCRATDPKLKSTIQVDRSRTTVKPVRTADGYRMEVRVRAKGTILETNCGVDLLKADVIHRMEVQISKEITDRMEQGLSSIQALQADVVGFADLIHRRDPKRWQQWEKDWPARFAKTEMKAEVDFTIRREGLSNKSMDSVLGLKTD
ncbi:Ger(x)C family spore germination protein [Cohnella zeiphila]|uniref:Ger(X)C family spore germination protein n=1 Tax=Cohnella zeiphila TaxID=2761120 RepID=A0A7X0SKS4_9BACL|nr:Ger(x)C family spore germination protein [Cohnella zeiphila]MBB6731761.1 Ger(x)C family spore germination protein [Cohnella zeiphila]